MQRACKIIMFIAATFFLLIAALGVLVFVQRNYQEQITFTGIGTVQVAVEVASFSFVVQELNKESGLAKDVITEKMESILEYLATQAIAEKDIQTRAYTIRPVYRYVPAPTGEERRREFQGYQVTQETKVTIRDLTKVDAILGHISGAGITEINSVTFSPDQEKIVMYEKEAVAKAIERAKTTAHEYAAAAGVTLRNVVNIYVRPHSDSSGPLYLRSASLESGASDGGSVVLPPGEQEITRQATLTYTTAAPFPFLPF